MSDDEGPKPGSGQVTAIGGVPIAIVKGGTTSSRYDRELQRREADAERRRKHEDRVRQIVATQEGGVARLGVTSFMRDMPRVVFFYMNRDGTVRQECVSEINFTEGPTQGSVDMFFTLICPRCLERGVPAGDAQLKVHNSHRKFFLREERHTVKLGIHNSVVLGRGEIVDLRTPDGDPWTVVVCGSISVQDILRCSNYNCNWAVRIDESRVYEV
jgi:hypothetical protein